MKKNLGTIDRILRTIIGLFLLGAGIFYKSWVGLVGVPLLLNALTGWCSLYHLFGVSTCRVKH